MRQVGTEVKTKKISDVGGHNSQDLSQTTGYYP